MSPACELGLALMAACVVVPPDGKPPVTVTHACIAHYSPDERRAAKACAAENGVTWRFSGSKRKRIR